jgi:uncharacterized protein YggT (Ycf19 family)
VTAAAQPSVGTDRHRERASLRRRSTTLTIARTIAYLAYAWVVVSLVILAFGFFLLLFGANPDAAFSQWVYRHLADTMEPFRGIFPQATTPTGMTLDVSVLFAMFVYSLIGLGVRSLIDWLTYRHDRLERDELRWEQSRLDQPHPERGPTSALG